VNEKGSKFRPLPWCSGLNIQAACRKFRFRLFFLSAVLLGIPSGVLLGIIPDLDNVDFYQRLHRLGEFFSAAFARWAEFLGDAISMRLCAIDYHGLFLSRDMSPASWISLRDKQRREQALLQRTQRGFYETVELTSMVAICVNTTSV
jgi:hypothetical protein